jgi:hypothetical protein
MTPHGYPHFYSSYGKNLHVSIGQTDGQTETLIWGGLGNLIGSSTKNLIILLRHKHLTTVEKIPTDVMEIVSTAGMKT